MAMGHGLTQESIVPPGPSDDLNATQSTQPGKHPSIAYMIIIWYYIYIYSVYIYVQYICIYIYIHTVYIYIIYVYKIHPGLKLAMLE